MVWYFAILLFIAYMVAIHLHNKLQQDCDYWKFEAIKATAELGEMKIAEEAMKGGEGE